MVHSEIDGPELDALKQQAVASGFASRVNFAGRLKGEELTRTIARHRIMAIPSTVEEGFPVTALEGIACGCVLVGTRGGGLPEAVGPCGLLVPRGDGKALSDALALLLTTPEVFGKLRVAARAHLDHHTDARFVERYRMAIEALHMR